MDISAIKTKFSRKLHVAFGMMLAITLALAWYFYDSVQWFEYDVERITIANSVLNGHRTLSAQTATKLTLIEESVANGAIRDLPRWHENVRMMRSSVVLIRRSLADESTLRRMDRETDEMQVLNEMERFVENIIASGEVIRRALDEQRLDDALAEGAALSSSGREEIFNELMTETLMLRRRELAEANIETISLAHYINGVLPLFMLTLAGLTTIIAWLISRTLTRSVNVLHHGAMAFTSGDLNHRIFFLFIPIHLLHSTLRYSLRDLFILLRFYKLIRTYQ